jgi:hypothetical protein
MSHSPNLKMWPKGTSGNPAGRAKGSLNKSTVLKMGGNRVFSKHPETGEMMDVTRYHVVLEQLYELAMKKGNMQAIKEIIERHEGKVPDKKEISGGLNIGDIMMEEVDAELAELERKQAIREDEDVDNRGEAEEDNSTED